MTKAWEYGKNRAQQLPTAAGGGLLVKVHILLLLSIVAASEPAEVLWVRRRMFL